MTKLNKNQESALKIANMRSGNTKFNVIKSGETGCGFVACKQLAEMGYLEVASIRQHRGVGWDTWYRITESGKAALGISDEPQPAVAVETPAAQDSEYQPEVGDVVAYGNEDAWDNDYIIQSYLAATDTYCITRRDSLGAQHEYCVNAIEITLVSRPTIAPIAITDDSAVDNTPSEPKREIAQPETLQYLTVNQAGEPVWKSVDDLPAGYEWRGGLITGHIVNTGIIEGTVKSGWVADALATINVEREAAAHDEYLPPTGDDNDDLPFSDLGEDDEIMARWHIISQDIDHAVIDSQIGRIYELEARVKELETALELSLKGIKQLCHDYDLPAISSWQFIHDVESVLLNQAVR